MPVSQGSAGGLPGMNLKAWALIDAGGALIKSMGVASAAKLATGEYRITFSAPMATTKYLGRFTLRGFYANAPGGLDGYIKTWSLGSCDLATLTGSGVMDVSGLWEFYE